MSRFINKNAIITGGSSGIGHAIYKRLLSEGANVVVWDILSLKDQYNSENSLFINVDVTRWADIENAHEKSINFHKLPIFNIYYWVNITELLFSARQNLEYWFKEYTSWRRTFFR